MKNDDEFKSLESALPYCFSKTRAKKGHYFLVAPGSITGKTEVIIFLHGYGGNFMYYPWLLRKQFPDRIILIPSWGGTWRNGTHIYIETMRKDAMKRLGIEKHGVKPWLLALSDGGAKASDIYRENMKDYAGLVLIATEMSSTSAGKLGADGVVMMLNGSIDRRFPIRKIRAQVKAVRKRVKGFRFVEIKGGDHYFMMMKEKRCFDEIKKFIGEMAEQDCRVDCLPVAGLDIDLRESLSQLFFPGLGDLGAAPKFDISEPGQRAEIVQARIRDIYTALQAQRFQGREVLECFHALVRDGHGLLDGGAYVESF
jgi:hypothetical protein